MLAKKILTALCLISLRHLSGMPQPKMKADDSQATIRRRSESEKQQHRKIQYRITERTVPEKSKYCTNKITGGTPTQCKQPQRLSSPVPGRVVVKALKALLHLDFEKAKKEDAKLTAKAFFDPRRPHDSKFHIWQKHKKYPVQELLYNPLNFDNALPSNPREKCRVIDCPSAIE